MAENDKKVTPGGAAETPKAPEEKTPAVGGADVKKDSTEKPAPETGAKVDEQRAADKKEAEAVKTDGADVKKDAPETPLEKTYNQLVSLNKDIQKIDPKKYSGDIGAFNNAIMPLRTALFQMRDADEKIKALFELPAKSKDLNTLKKRMDAVCKDLSKELMSDKCQWL